MSSLCIRITEQEDQNEGQSKSSKSKSFIGSEVIQGWADNKPGEDEQANERSIKQVQMYKETKIQEEKNFEQGK